MVERRTHSALGLAASRRNNFSSVTESASGRAGTQTCRVSQTRQSPPSCFADGETEAGEGRGWGPGPTVSSPRFLNPEKGGTLTLRQTFSVHHCFYPHESWLQLPCCRLNACVSPNSDVET